MPARGQGQRRLNPKTRSVATQGLPSSRITSRAPKKHKEHVYLNPATNMYERIVVPKKATKKATTRSAVDQMPLPMSRMLTQGSGEKNSDAQHFYRAQREARKVAKRRLNRAADKAARKRQHEAAQQAKDDREKEYIKSGEFGEWERTYGDENHPDLVRKRAERAARQANEARKGQAIGPKNKERAGWHSLLTN